MKKYKNEIIVFIVEAIFMTLELVASRVLAPYFGNTNILWTSIIGIILLTSSFGNFSGGILADKKDSNFNYRRNNWYIFKWVLFNTKFWKYRNIIWTIYNFNYIKLTCPC